MRKCNSFVVTNTLVPVNTGWKQSFPRPPLNKTDARSVSCYHETARHFILKILLYKQTWRNCFKSESYKVLTLKTLPRQWFIIPNPFMRRILQTHPRTSCSLGKETQTIFLNIKKCSRNHCSRKFNRNWLFRRKCNTFFCNHLKSPKRGYLFSSFLSASFTFFFFFILNTSSSPNPIDSFQTHSKRDFLWGIELFCGKRSRRRACSYTTVRLSVYLGYHLFPAWIRQSEPKGRPCLITCHLFILFILSIKIKIQLFAASSPSELRQLWVVGYAGHIWKAAFPHWSWALISVLMNNGIEAAAQRTLPCSLWRLTHAQALSPAPLYQGRKRSTKIPTAARTNMLKALKTKCVYFFSSIF